MIKTITNIQLNTATKLSQIQFNYDKQIVLIDNILRLKVAGVFTSDIAEHITEHGSKQEQVIGKGITQALNDDRGLALALKPWIASLAYEAIAAGQKTGDLEQGLQNAINVLEIKRKMSGKLVWTLVKPFATIMFICFASAMASVHLFPLMANGMDYEFWHPISKSAYAFGLFWYEHGSYIAAATLTILASAIISTPYLKGALRRHLDQLPFYRQYRLTLVVNTLRSLGYMVRAGHDLSAAITTLKNNSNPYLSLHLAIMHKRLQTERNIGFIMDSGLLNKEWVSMMKMVGKIGKHDETLLKGAELSQAQLNKEINKLSSIAEAIIKITGFGTLAFIIFGTVMIAVTSALNTNF